MTRGARLFSSTLLHGIIPWRGAEPPAALRADAEQMKPWRPETDSLANQTLINVTGLPQCSMRSGLRNFGPKTNDRRNLIILAEVARHIPGSQTIKLSSSHLDCAKKCALIDG